MDDARLPPLSGDVRGQDEEEVTTPSSTGRDANALTHRPRALAKLHPAALKPVARAKILSEGPSPETSAHAKPGARGAMASIAPSAAPESVPAGQAPDLRPFADQLIAIAKQLRAGEFDSHTPDMSSTETSGKPAQSATEPSKPGQSESPEAPQTLEPEQRRKAFAEMARTAYAKRRKRTSIFGDPELFGEPGWDILLDLYIAQVEQKPVSVSSACIGSASPPTTGLRWLGVLADQGLLEREHDPADQRRVLVRLTDKALEAMDDYFSSSANLHGDRRAART